MNTVKVVNTDGVVRGTKIVDVDSGVEIKGIEALTIDFDLEEGLVKVEMRIGLTLVDVKGKPTFYAIHPVSGKMIIVKSIETVEGNRITL